MKNVLAAGLVAAALPLLAVPVQAKGCIKGAIVGGVVGHMAGHHGMAGAAAGCAIGHHHAGKKAEATSSGANSTDKK